MESDKNYIQNNIKKNKGQLNQSFNNSTINISQNYNLDTKKLDKMISDILSNLDGVDDVIKYGILTAIDIIKEEFATTSPQQNVLIRVSKMLAPMLTVLNGIPVLTNNIQKLIDYLQTFMFH